MFAFWEVCLQNHGRVETLLEFVVLRLVSALLDMINSTTGTRTQVARVKAEYPNQLDYSGF